MKSQIALTITLLLLAAPQTQAEGLISLVVDSSAHDYNCSTVYENATATLELGIFQPVNPSFDDLGARAVTHIGGFECKLVPHEGVTILAVHFPVPAIDTGLNGGLHVGFGEPLPVTVGGKTTLATIDVLFGGETSFPIPAEMTLPCYLGFNTWIEVTEAYPASIPGFAAFLDADDTDDPLVAADVNAGPDFMFTLVQDPEVATEKESWEAIKAIYR